MRYLLDTHALIWFMEDNERLSPQAKQLIENQANDIFISKISLFEISIKLSIQKIELQTSLIEFIEQILIDGFKVLPLTNEQIINYQNLPVFAEHRDPFDRLLISTAQIENLKIITIDNKFSLYKDYVSIVW